MGRRFGESRIEFWIDRAGEVIESIAYGTGIVAAIVLGAVAIWIMCGGLV